MSNAETLLERIFDRPTKKSKPPTYLEVSRTILLEDKRSAVGNRRIPYRPESDLVQKYLIEQMDNPDWRKIVFTGPPQVSGKTTIGIILPAVRSAIMCRKPYGYALPTLNDLDKAYATKIRPTLISAGYGEHLPTKGPGSRQGRSPVIQFADPDSGEWEGSLIFLAGGAYGDTVAVMGIDEVDQFRAGDGTPNWAAIEDLEARTKSYGRQALVICVGTVESDDSSMILQMVKDGTNTIPWIRCPECLEHFEPKFDLLRWEEGDEETVTQTARMACPCCGALLTEKQRQAGLRSVLFCHDGQTVENGRVIGECKRTTTLSIRRTALDCSLADMRDVCWAWHQAKVRLDVQGDHEPLRKFTRYMMCAIYTGDIEEVADMAHLTRDTLEYKSGKSDILPAETIIREENGDSLHLAEAPEWADWITCGIDVQRGGKNAPGRLYVVIIAGNDEGQRGTIGWGHIVCSPKGRHPTKDELEDGLKRFRDLIPTFDLPPLLAVGLDTGDRQDELLDIIGEHANRPEWPQWLPVQGQPRKLNVETHYTHQHSGKRRKPKWCRDVDKVIYSRWNKGNFWLHFIDTDTLRDQIQRRLMTPNDQAGSWGIPSGLKGSDTLCRHLCATVKIKDDKGKIRWSEKPQDRKWHHEWSARRDLLDCHEYGEAAAQMKLKNKSTASEPKEEKDLKDFYGKKDEKPISGGPMSLEEWYGKK